MKTAGGLFRIGIALRLGKFFEVCLEVWF